MKTYLFAKLPHLILEDVMLLTSPRCSGGAPLSAEVRGLKKVHNLTSLLFSEDLATTPHIMVVKIRLARFGRRKAPFYNIVVAQARFVHHLLPHRLS